MKTNVSIELNDEQRNVLASLIDGKVTNRLARRAEVLGLVDACIERALSLTREDAAVGKVLSNIVIEDINRGGWSFISESAA